MNNQKMFQQGDVLLHGVKEVEGKEVFPQDTVFILAEGEVTGHRHKIVATKSVKMFKTSSGEIYLEITEKTPLLHEEHGTIVITPGKYKVSTVREWDHFEQAAREVQD